MIKWNVEIKCDDMKCINVMDNLNDKCNVMKWNVMWWNVMDEMKYDAMRCNMIKWNAMW